MDLRALVEQRRVIVCCGAGGVGKTTTSAALALAAAQLGRRALVLTIDPAKRLAQALGIPPTGKEPQRIDANILNKAGIVLPPTGELHAWMLDPKVVLESIVDRFAPTPFDAERIRRTKLYHTLTQVITGLQEYTAAEALFSFNEAGRFDLIVLDTPPSRNALDFLDAPRRLSRFLDERTLSVFVPEIAGRSTGLLKTASKIVGTALEKTFGGDFLRELRQFLEPFSKLFNKMRIHAEGVRKLLRSPEAAFLVVTSPEAAALDEAAFFRDRIHELGLVTEGFVLNRSYASDLPLVDPTQNAETDPVLHAAFQKMQPMVRAEKYRVEQDRKVFTRLVEEGQRHGGAGAAALPCLDEVVEDLSALNVLAQHIYKP